MLTGKNRIVRQMERPSQCHFFNRQLTVADLELEICLRGERTKTDFIHILFIYSFISYLTGNPERFH